MYADKIIKVSSPKRKEHIMHDPPRNSTFFNDCSFFAAHFISHNLVVAGAGSG